MLAFIKAFFSGLAAFIGGMFPPPAYDVRPEELPMNQDAEPIKEDPEPIKEIPEPIKTRADLIYEAARAMLGKDASPNNLAPLELSCAEAVSSIIHPFVQDIPPDVISTVVLNKHLRESKHLKGVLDAKPGTIIMSPAAGGVYGHCGIFLEGGRIASNDSRNGKFLYNYNIDTWVKEMRARRGLKIYYYEPI